MATRSEIIHKAATLPKGSAERRKLLAGMFEANRAKWALREIEEIDQKLKDLVEVLEDRSFGNGPSVADSSGDIARAITKIKMFRGIGELQAALKSIA